MIERVRFPNLSYDYKCFLVDRATMAIEHQTHLTLKIRNEWMQCLKDKRWVDEVLDDCNYDDWRFEGTDT